MQIRRLSPLQLHELREKAMPKDFPDGELKPFAAMQRLLQAGLYEPLLFADDAGTPMAYALLVAEPGNPCLLIDYFAVRRDLRGGGVGTRVLQALRERARRRAKVLLVECEHPDRAPDPDTARRRIGFYLRAGVHGTAIESQVYGVRYLVLALPCRRTYSEAEAAAGLRQLYVRMAPRPYERGSVIFYGN